MTDDPILLAKLEPSSTAEFIAEYCRLAKSPDFVTRVSYRHEIIFCCPILLAKKSVVFRRI